MQHLRSKVGQLHRLVILQRGDREGLRHPARVGGIDTVCIFPHGDTPGRHELGENRGGEVRARPLQRGGHAILRRGHETRDDHDWRQLFVVECIKLVLVRLVLPPRGELLRRHSVQRVDTAGSRGTLLTQTRAIRLDNQHIARIKPRRWRTLRLEVGKEGLRRPDFAKARDDFDRDTGDGAQHAKRLNNRQNVFAILADTGFDFVRDFRPSELFQR